MTNSRGSRSLPPYLRAQATPARASFRELLGNGVLVLPGVVDAITARIAERAGYRACYVTGSGLANARFGMADLGLTGLSEIVEQVYRLAGAVALPLVADADTGYGNAISVMHAVEELERAGASAVQIEDQESPKRCGHFDHKSVIAADEMEQKVRAAVRARADGRTSIIARTDARAVLGFPASIERGKRYAEAGADVIFIEAPETLDELEQIPRLLDGIPVMINVVDGGRTPVLSVRELEQMGYAIALYANVALRAAIAAVRGVLTDLRAGGDSRTLDGRIASWEERQELVHLADVEDLEREIALPPSPARPAPDGVGRGGA